MKVKKTCTLSPVTTGCCRESPTSFQLPRPLPVPSSNSFLNALLDTGLCACHLRHAAQPSGSGTVELNGHRAWHKGRGASEGRLCSSAAQPVGEAHAGATSGRGKCGWMTSMSCGRETRELSRSEQACCPVARLPIVQEKYVAECPAVHPACLHEDDSMAVSYNVSPFLRSTCV